MSWISLNSRTFSIAITAWSAKVLTSSICFSVKGRTSLRRMRMAPNALLSLTSGTASVVRCPNSRDGARASGKSSNAATMSSMCITDWSMIARPTVLPLVNGKVCATPFNSPKPVTYLKVSPSTRYRRASGASHSCAARCVTVSRTGITSVGLLLITRRISAIEVCRCSASLISVNSRAFSMAITAWLAKVLTRSICFCVNGRTSGR